MKTLILKILFIALITLGFEGCYTIIWSPDSEFPTEDNSSTTSVYYSDPYYGDYYYFYDTPWWWDVTPPAVTRPTREDGRSQPIQKPWRKRTGAQGSGNY